MLPELVLVVGFEPETFEVGLGLGGGDESLECS